MNTGSAWNIVYDLHSIRDRCNITGHGDCQISIAAANACLSEFPVLHLHEGLPLAPFPSWKLYENPFFVNGKLDPKYVSRYLNAPLDHAANSFTSASKGSQYKSLVPSAANRNGSLSSSNVDTPSMAPARNLVNSAFWEHRELHRRSQAQETTKPSDLVNMQAQGQPGCVAPLDSLKCPTLHLDCQISKANTSGEERLVNQSRVKMAACSIQATLANILQRLRIVEDKQSRSNAVIAKLRVEMEDGSSRIQELEFSHESALREINSLLQRFGEQMTTSRRKEQEKLRAAFARLRGEIEEERNTCRLLKLQNKKLLKELEEANMAAADAGEELDSERQARELMEEVCNELAREIGEDKVAVEQLKQQQAKSKEKVEEELKIMKLAALWKDERVKTKISEAQLELDDKHHMDMPLAGLRSRVEEFVSTISAASCESHRVSNNVCKENKDEKPKKIIEQAKLLRHALEFNMQQVVDNAVVQVQTDMDLKEESIRAPIIDDRHSQADLCECYSDKVEESANDRSMRSTAHVELQVRPDNYMVSYTKNPSKATRRHRVVVEDDLFDHSGIVSPQARKHSHDNKVEAEREEGPRRTMLDAEYVQASNQSLSPEHFLYEGNRLCFPARKLSKEHGPPVLVSLSGRGEVQYNESDFHCSPSSSRTSPMKGTAHQKQSPLHFEPSHYCVEENADVWEDDLTPNTRRVNCFFEDNVSQVCMDDEGRFSMRRQSRGVCPAVCVRTTKLVNATYPWKGRRVCAEHMRRDDNCIDNNVECFMHHEEDAKCQCPDGAESAEDEHREFGGFYYEPVMDDDLLEVDCRAHYRREPDVDNLNDVADHADEHEKSISKAYNRSGQQIIGPKTLTCKSLQHDGGGWTNAKGNGTSAKSGAREEASPMSTPPLYKLVLPTPSAIRVPSVKSHYTSPKSAARSLSPSKAQVLQCFRPPPSSPEHVSSKVVVSGSNRGAAKGEGVDIQHSEGGTHANTAHLGEEEEACGSRGAAEEKKGNSLRAELLKARELDLKPVNYNMNNKAAAAQAPPNKSSSPSSFRFSPLRRSLTSSRP